MKSERRSAPRYEEKGRIDAEDVCALPGVLDDISSTGCKVRFPVPVTIDMERTYELRLKMPYKELPSTMTLEGRPQWQHQNSDSSSFGFSFVQTDDLQKLMEFIETLKEKNTDDDEGIMNMLVDLKPNFVKF